MNKKGKFITFEGIDGSGKTTLSKFLSDYLTSQNIPNIQVVDTKGTSLAKNIRSVIMMEEQKAPIDSFVSSMLFMAARKDTYNNVIKPALYEGKWVICDRFFDSTLAYQGFENQDEEFIRKFSDLRKFSFENIRPDLTILLNIPVDISQRRIETRGHLDVFDEKSLSYRERVRKGFLTISMNEKDRFLCLNANKSTNDIEKIIVKEIRKRYFDNNFLNYQINNKGREI